MEKEIVANHIAQVQKAIDVMATNPGMNLRQVGDEVGVTGRTIANWIAQPKVVEKIYDRYMELAGKHLPEVVQAIIEEAKLGNVHAARLILEHFGKLQNTLRIQVESNFERFMKADDAEEVDFFEVTDGQEEVLNQLTDEDIVLPERHPSNNKPKVREQYEKNRLKYKINKAKTTPIEAEKQSSRSQVRKRAKEVGLDLLPPGRHTKSERDKWMEKLEKLEKDEL